MARTYGGNPLAMAVGNAAIDHGPGAGLSRSCQQGRQLSAASNWARWWPAIPTIFEGVRGQGLMLGLKMKVPNGDFIAAARDAGLIVLPAGDNVVRLLPPLTLTEDEAREGVGAAGQGRRRVGSAESGGPMNAPVEIPAPAFSRSVRSRQRHAARPDRRRQGAASGARAACPRACPMPTGRWTAGCWR